MALRLPWNPRIDCRRREIWYPLAENIITKDRTQDYYLKECSSTNAPSPFNQISTITLQKLCQVGGKEDLFLFVVSMPHLLLPLKGIQTSKFPKNIKNMLMFSTKSKLVNFQSIDRTIVPLTSNQEKTHCGVRCTIFTN